MVNSTAWIDDEQRKQLAGDTGMEKALTGGCFTAIVSPEGKLLGKPMTDADGAGMVIAELDFDLITKRKRMMDSVGHYARPELLSLLINRESHVHAQSTGNATTNDLTAAEAVKMIATEAPPLHTALQSYGLRWEEPAQRGYAQGGPAPVIIKRLSLMAPP